MTQQIGDMQNQLSSFAENKKKEIKILFEQIRKCKSELKQAENYNKHLEAENARFKNPSEGFQMRDTIDQDKISASPRIIESKQNESHHEKGLIEEISKLKEIIQSSSNQIQKQAKEISDLNMHIQFLNQTNDGKLKESIRIHQETSNQKDSIIDNQKQELQKNQLKFEELSLIIKNKDENHKQQFESLNIKLNEHKEKLNNLTKQNSILVQEIDQEKSKNDDIINAHEKKLKDVHSSFTMLKEQKESFVKKSEIKLKNLEEINKSNEEIIKVKEKELEYIYSKISTTTGVKDILKALEGKIQG